MSEFNADSFRDERMIFLKELASNPDRDAYELCDTLSLPKPKVMSFLMTYFTAVAKNTDTDDRLTKESYSNIRNDISLGVRSEFGELTDREVDNLFYVYEKYRKIEPTLYFEADQARALKMTQPRQVAHDASNIPQPEAFTPPHQPETPQQKDSGYYNKSARPQTVNDPSMTDSNVDRLNKGYSYEFLYSLTRVGLLRFVLEGLPYPPSTAKIEGFIQFFELNQDELMASPDSLRDRLMRYFGDKTGEQASVAVNSYIRYLRPEYKFGVQKLGGQLRDGYFIGNDPLYGRLGGAIPMQQDPNSGIWGTGAIPQQGPQGPRWQDPFNTFYHAELVLPYGMDARSEDAKRLIHEWEAKKKRKKEMDEAQADIMQKINQQMAFSMTDVLNRGKQANGGGSSLFGPDFLQSLVAMGLVGMVTSGKANMMPYTDENGKLQIKMEQVPQLDHAPMVDPNAINAKDILQLMSGMYEKIAEKSTEAMQARIDGLRDQMGLNGEKKDPISAVGEMMQGLRQVIPGLDQQFSGGGMANIDMAKILLERDKFNYDKERSDTLIDHQFEIKKMEKEHEQEAEIEAAKTRQHTIDGITKAIKSALPQLIQLVMMFISMRNPNAAPLAGLGGAAAGGGGLGDILGNVFKMFSGGGQGGNDNEGEEEDEDEGGSNNPLGALFGGGGKSDNDNDEDGGGFNLQDIVSNVMPGVMGMLQGQQQQKPRYPQAAQPEIHSGHHHHQNRMRSYDQGDGVRPSFLDVEVGNDNAATLTPMVEPGEPADNIYENIESEHRVIQSKPGVNPQLISEELTVSKVITAPTPPETDMDDPNVIKLPRYQDKLMNKPTQPESGVVIPSPRQTVNTYPDEQLTAEPPGDDEAEPYPIYSPEDFDDLPTGELREAANEAAEAVKSAESYMHSINEQRKKRARKR